MYCFGHFWCLIPILFMNAGKTKKPREDDDNKEENEEKEEQSSTIKYDDFNELRNRVNRKLALLKEYFFGV